MERNIYVDIDIDIDTYTYTYIYKHHVEPHFVCGELSQLVRGGAHAAQRSLRAPCEANGRLKG